MSLIVQVRRLHFLHIGTAGWEPLMTTMNSIGQIISAVLAKKPLLELERDFAGIDLDGNDENGWTPILAASEAGLLEAVQFFADKGASVNRASPSGLTPLHLACQGGHLDVARYLLENDAQVDAKTPQGISPLMIAAAWDYSDVVDLLLQRGANPNSRDILGQNALDIALDKNSTSSVAILNSLGPKFSEQLTTQDSVPTDPKASTTMD